MSDLTAALPQQIAPQVLDAIWSATRKIDFQMASESLCCSLLRTLAASKVAGRFLELGTGTGLSTAWLLAGMDAQSTLLSMDNDAQALAVAEQHLGSDQRLKLICQDGQEFVHSLKGQQFDFIFADTWAGKYQLLDETLDLLAPGGFYVIDDMLPQPNWPDGHSQKASQLLANLCSMHFLKVTTLNWATGMVLATRLPA